jgi:protein O-mannosyl-transferase
MKTVNFAIHLICCCLLTNFLSALEFDTTSIKFASLMFATHPIHTEAVSGIVSRSDLIACFTFLICGIIYFNIFNSINIKLTKKVQFLTLITVGCISAIGILFKESAIMILVRRNI